MRILLNYRHHLTNINYQGQWVEVRKENVPDKIEPKKLVHAKSVRSFKTQRSQKSVHHIQVFQNPSKPKGYPFLQGRPNLPPRYHPFNQMGRPPMFGADMSNGQKPR